ncbi:MAG TPA: oligosaccharide flippase family protein [Elusimicrobiota bacterium]|nr:oligosaccharide flippase family protein [Elusimicrobiota bacterium]
MTSSTTDLLKRSYGLSLAGTACVRTAGFVFNILLARYLGASSFGEFMIYLAVLQFAVMLSDAGFGAGALRFMALFSGQGNTVKEADTFRFSGLVILSLSFVTALLLWSLRHPLSVLFKADNISWMIEYTFFFVSVTALAQFLMQAMQGSQDFRRMIVFRDILEPLLRLAVCAAALLLGFRLAAALASYVTGQLFLCLAAAVFFAKKWRGILFKTTFSTEVLRPLVLFSIPLLLTNLTNYLFQWMDTLILGSLVSTKDVGIYSSAMRWASLGGTPLAALAPIFLPTITRLHGEGRREEITSLYRKITAGLISFGWLFLFIVTAYADALMGFFGPEFREQGRYILPLLSLGVYINVATGPTGSFFHMTGRSKLMFYTALSLMPIALFTNYYLISRWGLWGAAIAYTFVVSLSNIVNVVALWFCEGITPYSSASALVFLTGGVFFVVTLAIRVWVPVPVWADGLIWMGIYPALLIRFKILPGPGDWKRWIQGT